MKIARWLWAFAACLPLFSAGAAQLPIPAGGFDKTFYSAEGAAVRVVYSAASVEKYARIMNVDVPSRILLENLGVHVDAARITERELGWARVKVPFEIRAKNFLLSVRGKKKTLSIKAGSAFLTPLNTISLKGGVVLGSGQKSVNVGESAELSLQGRMLVLACGGRKFGFKF